MTTATLRMGIDHYDFRLTGCANFNCMLRAEQSPIALFPLIGQVNLRDEMRSIDFLEGLELRLVLTYVTD